MGVAEWWSSEVRGRFITSGSELDGVCGSKEVWLFDQFSELGGLRWPRGRLVAECDEKGEHGTEVGRRRRIAYVK